MDIIDKYKKIMILDIIHYTKSFHSAVGHILDYANEVSGYKNFPQIDAVQNKSIRIWREEGGGHKFIPIAAINRDMGWTSSYVRHKTNIIRIWNKLMCMNNNCLPKIIFNWDYSCRGNTWSSNINSIFDDINCQNEFISKSQVSMNN